MSRVVEQALEAVVKSEFNFINERQLEVRNAFIFWTNFAGRENKFGNKAKTFNLAISLEIAEILNTQGWRVRDILNKIDDDDEGETLYFVNIKVNMESSYPPIVTLFSEFRGERSRRALDNETISELDRLDILSSDCIVNSYESRQYPGKVTGYLSKLNIIQEPNQEFGGKYDDWLAEDHEDTLDDDIPFETRED